MLLRTKFTTAVLGSFIFLLGACEADDPTIDDTPSTIQQNPNQTPPNNQPATPPAPEN